MDVQTGEPRFGNTHQGYSDTSCWSRGQAWGIYGFLLSYQHTGDKQMVELSRSLAHYFLNRLPEDDVCHWDLALLGTDAVRDSSAAAIAACGLLELVKALPTLDANRAYYEEMALRIALSLTDNYLAHDDDPTEGLLQHSVYHMGSGKGSISAVAGETISILSCWRGCDRFGTRTGNPEAMESKMKSVAVLLAPGFEEGKRSSPSISCVA
jgi:unsaturated chondroitin disaccharide hydrolase